MQFCRNGSDCELQCGEFDEDVYGPCQAECDDTSACHVTCGGSCVLCCNGSTDCSMDCPDGGQSCGGDAIACGASCPVDPATLESGEDPRGYNFCPSLESLEPTTTCGVLR